MTVFEFMNLSLEENLQQLRLYDCEIETIVFEGYFEDIPLKYEYKEILSWEIVNEEKICLNI